MRRFSIRRCIRMGFSIVSVTCNTRVCSYSNPMMPCLPHTVLPKLYMRLQFAYCGFSSVEAFQERKNSERDYLKKDSEKLNLLIFSEKEDMNLTV